MVRKKKSFGSKKLKTFNLNSDNYEKFSLYCRNEGISMSKKVDNFIQSELEKLGLHLEIDKEINVRRNGGDVKTTEFSKMGGSEHSFKKYC